MKLYEYADQYRHMVRTISEMDFSDSEMTPEEQDDMIRDTLSSIQTSAEEKIKAIGALICTLDFEAQNLREIEKRQAQRRRVAERKIEFLKEYTRMSMEALNIKSVKDKQVNVSIKTNPPSVVILDQKALPEWALTSEIIVHVSKTKLAQALKAGEEIPGAMLRQSTRLEVR